MRFPDIVIMHDLFQRGMVGIVCDCARCPTGQTLEVKNYFDDACPTTTGQIYEGSSFIQLNTICKCMDEEFKKM